MPTSLSISDAVARALFDPRSVALFGVSADPRKNTARPLRFMRKHGYQGKIHLVNPRHSEILGEPALQSLSQVPDSVDHAFIMVGREQVRNALDDCATRGVRLASIYSDGFGESGPEGMERQQELVGYARKLGVRILGPNSIGAANLHTGFIASVNAVFETEKFIHGDISLVSQSGSMMGSLLSRAWGGGLGFSKSVSVGNEADVCVGEVVSTLVDDPTTSVILLFLETIRHPDLLSAALTEARSAGKPVVAYKLGRSALGNELSLSHTGAIAGSDAAVDAFFRAHGVLRVEQLETLFEIAPLVSRFRGSTALHKGSPRVAVLTTTGGGAATVADNLGVRGLTCVTPPDEFVDRMSKRGTRVRQAPVIDLTLAATSQEYREVLDELLTSDWCDAVLCVAGSSAQFHPELVVQPIIQCRNPFDKPLAVFLSPDAPESLHRLRAHGIAAFRTPEACADALSTLLHQPASLDLVPIKHPKRRWPNDVPDRSTLSEYEASRLFAELGILHPPSQLLPVSRLSHQIPYPVVAKISSPNLLHKTEAGAVRIGIRSDDELRNSVAEMLASVDRHTPGIPIDGVLVQKMEDSLLELMIGYRVDPLVGPTVVLSAGGVAAEISPDCSVRLAPVSLAQAREMVFEVRHTKLVRGFRGLPMGDCEGIARAIAAFSNLALYEQPSVIEAEINPLLVQADRVVAVDGLLHLGSLPLAPST